MKEGVRDIKIHAGTCTAAYVRIYSSYKVNELGAKLLEPKFTHWGDKRYNSLNNHLRRLFGQKVFKLSLDAGFTCPNRDGSKSLGGCTFCSSQGSGDFIPDKKAALHVQMHKGIELVKKKWKSTAYIAYFQAYSNTYAPIEVLRGIYEEALSFPGVVGLAIATRPDCINPEVAKLLQELNQKTYLWLELGLQSIHEYSLNACNVQYTFADFHNAVQLLLTYQIRICPHVIFGLPGEDKEQMLATIQALRGYPLYGIKLHMLQILENSELGRRYKADPFPLLSQDQYVECIADALEIISPEVVIHRLTGDGPRSTLIEPKWALKKFEVLNQIDAELLRRSSMQGRYHNGSDLCESF